MKDRRIWVIIGCILVVGIAITSYTSSVVKKVPQEQKIQVLSETTAETAVDSDSAPLQAVPREAQAKMKAGDPEQTEAAGAGIRSEKETEARTAEETEESNSSEIRCRSRRQILRMKVWSRFYMMQNRNRKAIQTA